MPQLIDLTGKKFNDWIVLERATDSKGNLKSWLCRCKCGKEEVVSSYYLRNKWKAQDCGCTTTLVGKTFGKLAVLEKIGKKANTLSSYRCRCECGKFTIVRAHHLIYSKTKSCGCAITHKSEKIGPQMVYNHYKQASKKRKINFQLSKEQVFKIILEECFYCGEKRGNTFRIRGTIRFPERIFSYNGIDRKDNSKGYTEDNSVPCCPNCNLMKRNMDLQSWMEHMNKIIRFQKNKSALLS